MTQAYKVQGAHRAGMEIHAGKGKKVINFKKEFAGWGVAWYSGNGKFSVGDRRSTVKNG